VKGFWFRDVVDVSWVSDGEVPKIFVLWFDSVVDVNLILSPKAVICEIIPMDLSLDF
jgi:hypothetical protein